MESSIGDNAPLIVHIIFRLDVGGLENGLVNLINKIPKDRYRHAIVCLTDFSDFRFRIRDQTISIFALNKKEGKDFIVYFKLWRLLAKLRPAIVHTRNLGTLDCLLAAKLAGVKHTIHGEHGWDTYDLYGTNRKYNLIRRACRPLVERYIALSHDLESWLRVQIRVPRNKINRIYNGVDTSKFYPAKDKQHLINVKDFLSADSFVIGTVGRLELVKDQLTLIRAFTYLRSRSEKARKTLRLIIVGEGSQRSKLAAFLRETGASSDVWFSGRRDDIAELLHMFDVFVLPSLNEGISNTILEAMAAGLPVIATRTGGNPELVLEDRTGFLVPASDPVGLGNAIAKYIEDRALIKRHGDAGRRRVESDFSLDAMVNSYLGVYDNVLRER